MPLDVMENYQPSMRHPLGEATGRVNNHQQQPSLGRAKTLPGQYLDQSATNYKQPQSSTPYEGSSSGSTQRRESEGAGNANQNYPTYSTTTYSQSQTSSQRSSQAANHHNRNVVFSTTGHQQDSHMSAYNGPLFHPPYDPPENPSSHYRTPSQEVGYPGPVAPNPRVTAIANDSSTAKRESQASTTSTITSKKGGIKFVVGPWRLGKTLGKGSTARVRLARHSVTQKDAAVKIVMKRSAQISQAGSLADLERADALETDKSLRRMPIGIEREVAIMKLIEHPNIMKIYDIWENRNEIYLVLEYVDGGELFDYISDKGRLYEEEAVRFFRQMISAVGYCHTFNICHRDLKPENILLTKSGDIKIADFGMAALQQGPDHKLQTSCGSPHYAAPELIKGSPYRGNLIDIWSMGVILYAMLAGKLPFDVKNHVKDWMPVLLGKIKKGHFEMSSVFSEDAKSLIRLMLVVDPRERITMSEIWEQPLVRKYEHLDNLGSGAFPQSPRAKDVARPIRRREDVDEDIVRQLRSMWHTLTEDDLVDKLMSRERNEQKLFYSLLQKYNDAQLESFTPPDLEYSASDYHHIRPKPPKLSKSVSTCHFGQEEAKGPQRQASKFTVISHSSEKSYDPFHASRPQNLNLSGETKIVIHRNQPHIHDKSYPTYTYRMPSRSLSRNLSSRNLSSRDLSSRNFSSRNLTVPRSYASRSSIASSTVSRGSAARAVNTYKRNVSFIHNKKSLLGNQRGVTNGTSKVESRHSNHTEITDDGGDTLRPIGSSISSTNYIRSKKSRPVPTEYVPLPKPGRSSLIWHEDVRQLSSSLAKDCDEAFNRSSMVSESEISHLKSANLSTFNTGKVKQSSTWQTVSTIQPLNRTALESRPLPTPPARTESVKVQLLQAREDAERRRRKGEESSRHLNRMVTHIDDLMMSPPKNNDRRYASAPLETRPISGRPLPSIYETMNEETLRKSPEVYTPYTDYRNGRTASAPEPRVVQKKSDRFSRPDSDVRDTIRVVDHSYPWSPVKMPSPLKIVKKDAQGRPLQPLSFVSDHHSLNYQTSGSELRQQYQTGNTDLATINEGHDDDHADNNSNKTIVRKKSTSWYRRSSRSGEDVRNSVTRGESLRSKNSSNSTIQPANERPSNPVAKPSPEKKKRGFGLRKLFKKMKPTDNAHEEMMVTADDGFVDEEPEHQDVMDNRSSWNKRRQGSDEVIYRQIAPQRNWLAKLFHVKPLSRCICLTLNQKLARREATTLLRGWKKYGIENIVVDKLRNIVFGRVGVNNYLQVKEVEFAIEFMQVIEHGARSQLCIARLTQERGAASSFLKVYDTMLSVFTVRQWIVEDKRKEMMMIKTLEAMR